MSEMENEPRPNPNGGSRPVPDPTLLTTSLVEKAMEGEEKRVDGLLEVLRERLHAIDVATDLRLRVIDHVPDRIDEKVATLAALMGEKFGSVDQRFTERDIRSEREARDNKVAVDAAFAAQKEAAAKQDEGNQKAIDKSEKATTESINKLAELFATSNAGLVDKIGDVSRRVDRIESLTIGATVGAGQVKDQQQSARTLVFAVLTAVLGIIAVGASILAATGN